MRQLLDRGKEQEAFVFTARAKEPNPGAGESKLKALGLSFGPTCCPRGLKSWEGGGPVVVFWMGSCER